MANSERIDLLNEVPQRVEALLAEFFEQNNVPKYRIKQALSWIYERDAAGFAAMTDLPTKIREKLAETFDFANPESARVEVSHDGSVKRSRRRADRIRFDPRPRPFDAVHLIAGGLCDGLHVLRDGMVGLSSQSHPR